MNIYLKHGLNHGEYNLSITNNIIKIVLSGAFNAKGIREILNKITKEINKLDGNKFAILVNYLDLFGATSEAFEVIEEFDEWLTTQNMVAKARVIINETKSNNIDNKINLRQKSKHKNFDVEHIALYWLKKMLGNNKIKTIT